MTIFSKHHKHFLKRHLRHRKSCNRTFWGQNRAIDPPPPEEIYGKYYPLGRYYGHPWYLPLSVHFIAILSNLTLFRASLFGVAQRAGVGASKNPPLAKSLISIVEVWFSYQNASTSYFQSIKTICRAIKALFVWFFRYPKLLIISTQNLLST